MFWEYAIELRTLPVLDEKDKLAVKDAATVFAKLNLKDHKQIVVCLVKTRSTCETNDI